MGGRVRGSAREGGCAFACLSPGGGAPRGKDCLARALADPPLGGDRSDGCALDGLSLPELLELLPDLEAEVDASHARLRACVALLRQRRASWREIGDALAVSRQAAWERFRAAAAAGEH